MMGLEDPDGEEGDKILPLPTEYKRPQPRGGQVPRPDADPGPLPVLRAERANSMQPKLARGANLN